MPKERKRTMVLIAGALLICMGFAHLIGTHLHRNRFGVLDESVLIRVPADSVPDGAFFITPQRREYRRGKMTLIIPAIDVFTPVGESTDAEGLEEMPGLYEFAQLPGQGDVNVSIAGHRDIFDEVFYSLDRLGTYDYLYLLYDGDVYQYLFRESKVVKPDAWSVIQRQGYSCLTLTTCDPIGTTRNRLVVTGELVGVEPFGKHYRFIASQAPLP